MMATSMRERKADQERSRLADFVLTTDRRRHPGRQSHGAGPMVALARYVFGAKAAVRAQYPLARELRAKLGRHVSVGVCRYRGGGGLMRLDLGTVRTAFYS
jgi:hypothetical protein